jgi:hypothetical protein
MYFTGYEKLFYQIFSYSDTEIRKNCFIEEQIVEVVSDKAKALPNGSKAEIFS